MSNTLEYYVRKAEETDARGPFNLEQLASLAENGQIDLDTYYYDAGAEAWAPLSGNPELIAQIFPTRKTLRVKAKSAAEVATINSNQDNAPAITVNDMLLAAEGLTEETKDKLDPAIAQAKAAGIGLYAALAILIVCAAAFILPSVDRLFALDVPGIIAAPLSILGLLHLGLAAALGLGAVTAYPVVRFAAMLTLGFAGTLFHLEGHPLPVLFSALAAAGLFLCTLLVHLQGVIFAAAAGFIGACGIAHHLFTR